MSKTIGVAMFAVAFCLVGAGAARAQGMMLDYAADRVIEKYQSSSCDQLKAMKQQPPNEKEKAALDFLRGDEQARRDFIDRIAAPVANKMFECGMFP